MGCKNCGKATTVTGSKPYRIPVIIPFGSDMRIKIQGVQEKIPFDFDTGSFSMEVYEAGLEADDLAEAEPLFTFGDSDFERSQSETAIDDEDVNWNDVVIFHGLKSSEMLQKLCYEQEYPFIITFTDDGSGVTYTRWLSYIQKQGL